MLWLSPLPLMIITRSIIRSHAGDGSGSCSGTSTITCTLTFSVAGTATITIPVEVDASASPGLIRNEAVLKKKDAPQNTCGSGAAKIIASAVSISSWGWVVEGGADSSSVLGGITCQTLWDLTREVQAGLELKKTGGMSTAAPPVSEPLPKEKKTLS